MSFSSKQIEFLKSIEECRMATSYNDIPHVKPVSFLLFDLEILIATDYQTRSFKNLKTNPKIAVTIDKYESGNHKAILVQGDTEIIENGKEFKTIYEKFYEKFQWVKNDPWTENEAPFIRVKAKKILSWGI